MRRILRAATLGCVALVLSTLCSAQEPDWKVGLARVKITPPQPVFMAGYASRNKPYESVHDDLFAKVLVLDDKAGTRGVMVTTDLIGFSAEIATPLRERVAAKMKTDAKSVIIRTKYFHIIC